MQEGRMSQVYKVSMHQILANLVNEASLYNQNCMKKINKFKASSMIYFHYLLNVLSYDYK